MKFETFSFCHLAEASLLAKTAYENACAAFPALPQDVPLPDFSPLLNGMGTAAVEGGRLIGFLGAWEPFPRAFGTAFPGVLSPVFAHGLAPDAPEKTMQLMYQKAAEKWAAAGAAYHIVCLYEHEKTAIRTLFRYGFGLRCADAVRKAMPLHAAPVPGFHCTELSPADENALTPLREGLWRHLQQSPCFLCGSEKEMQKWLQNRKSFPSRRFAALWQEKPVAYIEVTQNGENFITAHSAMLNICGAYCEPAFRGTGVSRMLLDFLLHTLQGEGVSHLGVDYETMNPTAAGFWEKHFTPYTQSLVRRLDCI